MKITFPRAVYRNGEYAEAANETELKQLESEGYADWAIDSVRTSEPQEKPEEAPKRRGRPPKVEVAVEGGDHDAE